VLSGASAIDMAVVLEVPRPFLPPLTVEITREMWSDLFVIKRLDNGHTEELETEETRDWFKAHGADMVKIDKVLDHVYNFQKATCTIAKPIEPKVQQRDAEPQL
jgi:hypothetical protein